VESSLEQAQGLLDVLKNAPEEEAYALLAYIRTLPRYSDLRHNGESVQAAEVLQRVEEEVSAG
jgi:hypothetical protein